jgi:hypothetical protein
MRKFPWFLGFVLLVAALPVPAQRKTYPTAAQVNTDADLQRLYIADNATYFNNTLPLHISVKWADLPHEKNGDAVMGDIAEDPQHRAQYIRIDRATNVTWGTVVLTMRHEECHAKVDPYLTAEEYEDDNLVHGERFQNCMIELAKDGAFKGAW